MTEFEVKIPMPERHEIFVTPHDYSPGPSNSFPPEPGVIGHLGDADWHCSYLAAISKRGGIDGWDPTDQQAGTLGKRVLGIPGINAYSRIFIEAPVYDTTGQLIAADHNELWSQGPRVPVMFDPVGLQLLDKLRFGLDRDMVVRQSLMKRVAPGMILPVAVRPVMQLSLDRSGYLVAD